jgi:hypothetical protein
MTSHLFMLGREKLLSFFERGDSHLSRNGGITLKELFEGMPSLQRVKEELKGHARTAKHRRSTKNVWIFDDDAIGGIHSRLQCEQYTTARVVVPDHEEYV